MPNCDWLSKTYLLRNVASIYLKLEVGAKSVFQMAELEVQSAIDC